MKLPMDHRLAWYMRTGGGEVAVTPLGEAHPQHTLSLAGDRSVRSLEVEQAAVPHSPLPAHLSVLKIIDSYVNYLVIIF